MTDKPDDFSSQRQNEGEPADDSAEQTTEGAERTPDGRFAPGFCPNPSGRPRKQRAALPDVLSKILNETVPGSAAGSLDPMTILEGLWRSACVKGFKDPGLALAIIKFMASMPQPKTSDDDRNIDYNERGRALDRYVERELRRKALDQNSPVRDASDDDKEGGS